MELGGAQRSTLDLLSSLDPREFELELIASPQGLLAEEASQIPHLRFVPDPSLVRQIHPVNDARAFQSLRHRLRRTRPHCVHTHSPKAGILGRFAAAAAGVPNIVHTVHGWSFNRFQPAPLRSLFLNLERQAARVTNSLVTVSEADQTLGLNQGIGKRQQYELIRYGIDFERFFSHPNGQARAKAALGWSPKNLVVGAVSCLKAQKAPMDLVRAFELIARAVPEARFVWAGDGVFRKRVERALWFKGLHEKTRLLGWSRDIPELLCAMDVYVLGSLWEGFPVSVLEAMRQAKAVVVSNTGGVSEVIKHGVNGYLVEPGDWGALAGYTIRLLKEESLRRSFEEKAAQSVDSAYTQEAFVSRTAELYRRAGEPVPCIL
ncbi:MAG: glycosyltransferase family 4 protein [Candidatus Omnitrophica bacterium]|nr:glycosyltransferase family 4 protein [Candidatus Omnitrophota bacterium]